MGIDVYVTLHVFVCVCMHVKGARWLALAVREKESLAFWRRRGTAPACVY